MIYTEAQVPSAYDDPTLNGEQERSDVPARELDDFTLWMIPEGDDGNPEAGIQANTNKVMVPLTILDDMKSKVKSGHDSQAGKHKLVAMGTLLKPRIINSESLAFQRQHQHAPQSKDSSGPPENANSMDIDTKPPAVLATEESRAEVVPIRVFIRDIIDWCIEYGQEPCLWMHSEKAWYRLHRPSIEYTSTFEPVRLRFELCARAYILSLAMTPKQATYKSFVKYLSGPYNDMRGYSEDEISEVREFILEQAASLEDQSLMKTGFIRTLKERQRREKEASGAPPDQLFIGRRYEYKPLPPKGEKLLWQRFRKILQGFMSTRPGSHFLYPVDPVADGVPDYPDIVKTPMDLGTIISKMDTKGYQSIQEAVEDVRLVWSNCLLYNPPSTEVAKDAIFLEEKFEEQMIGSDAVVRKETSGFKLVGQAGDNEDGAVLKEEKEPKKRARSSTPKAKAASTNPKSSPIRSEEGGDYVDDDDDDDDVSNLLAEGGDDFEDSAGVVQKPNGKVVSKTKAESNGTAAKKPRSSPKTKSDKPAVKKEVTPIVMTAVESEPSGLESALRSPGNNPLPMPIRGLRLKFEDTPDKLAEMTPTPKTVGRRPGLPSAEANQVVFRAELSSGVQYELADEDKIVGPLDDGFFCTKVLPLLKQISPERRTRGQCLVPTCLNKPRVMSRYCSHSCGMQFASLRLAYFSSQPAATENGFQRQIRAMGKRHRESVQVKRALEKSLAESGGGIVKRRRRSSKNPGESPSGSPDGLVPADGQVGAGGEIAASGAKPPKPVKKLGRPKTKPDPATAAATAALTAALVAASGGSAAPVNLSEPKAVSAAPVVKGAPTVSPATGISTAPFNPQPALANASSVDPVKTESVNMDTTS